MREEVKQFKQTNHELVVENLSLREQLLKVKDEEKEREEEVEELRKEVKLLKMQHLDESKYLQWGPDEITAWVINLDPKRLGKYEKKLEKALFEEEAVSDDPLVFGASLQLASNEPCMPKPNLCVRVQ